MNRRTRTGFTSLDHVDWAIVFKMRASVMQSSPKFSVGAYRSAIRVALQKADQGLAAGKRSAFDQNLENFFLLPRMLFAQTGPRTFGSEGKVDKEV